MQMSKNAEERFRCTDKILEEFLSEHGEVLNKSAVRRALAHKYYLRWEYYRLNNPRLAKRYLKEAVKHKIEWIRVIKGLVAPHVKACMKH